MIEFKNVEYFVKTCRSKTITQAAEELFVSQQSLSKCIQNLEHDLNGQTLFMRSKKGIVLTEYGKFLFKKFAPVVDSYHSAKNEVLKNSITGRKTVTVKNSRYLFGLFFPDIYEGFRRSHPEIELVLEDCPDKEILGYVLSDPGNIGLIAVTGYWKDERIRRVVVKSYDLQLCLHKDNPLAGRRKVCVGDIEREKILLFDDRSFNKSLILVKSEKYGFRPEIAYRSSDMHQLLSMANNGNGIIICTPTSIQKAYPDLRFVPFTDRDMKLNVEFIFRTNEKLTEETKIFIEYMIAEVKNPGPEQYPAE